jgi:hypothetical protein
MPNCPGDFVERFHAEPTANDSQDAHEAELAAYDMQISEMQAQLDELAKPRQTTVIERQEFLTEEKRARLRELVDE